MELQAMPVLIDHFRETMEGKFENSAAWITDGRKDSGVFGSIAPLSHQQAFAAPVPGARSVAAHTEHLRFSLDLMFERMQGNNPKADWQGSFNLPPASAEAWTGLQSELHRAYAAVLEVLQLQRSTPVENMPPLHVAGLSALTAHNAYHLGAIRQIAKVVQGRSGGSPKLA